jgi:hypothetical protein
MRHLGIALGSKSSGFVLVLGLVLLGSMPTASAAGLDKKGTADAKKATQLYKQGSYEDAAGLFLQLSLDNPGMPVFVRNLGACYYYLRRPEPALSNLREYLHKKQDIDPKDREEVEKWIAEMDELRRGTGAKPAEAPTMPPAPGMAPVTAPGVMPNAPAQAPYPSYQPVPMTGYPTAPATPGWAPPGPGPDPSAGSWPVPATGAPGVAAQPEAPSKSNGRMTAAWILGGVGVAALVTGGVCTLMATSRFSDVEKKYDPGKESDGKTFATAQWIGYGVGAAAITTAVILAVTSKSSSGTVALAPTVGPGQAGAALSGSF